MRRRAMRASLHTIAAQSASDTAMCASQIRSSIHTKGQAPAARPPGRIEYVYDLYLGRFPDFPEVDLRNWHDDDPTMPVRHFDPRCDDSINAGIAISS
jgi:hypothetical protein